MTEETFWANEAPKAKAIEPQVLPPTNLALEVPQEVSSLARQDNQFLALAQEYVVDSEPAFQVADEIQSRLKREAKAIEEKRMAFTRPIDAIKKQWTDFFKPAVEARNQAAALYQSKMAQYRSELRKKAELAQRDAERILREQKERELEEARKLEAKASRLKTAAAQQRAMEKADEIRAAAAMMPESVALAASEPQTVASNVAELWRAEVTDIPAFLGWLQQRPEWLCVINFKDSELNRLAKQCQNVVKVPGVRFFTKDSFRSKPR